MCGRFVTPDIAEAERNFLVHLRHWQEYERSFNVAPTDPVPVVRMLEGDREGLLMRWGLVPYFAAGIAPKYSTINARLEKLDSAPAWRGPWSHGQRCILPALGFYEWHHLPDGTRQPYFITCADQALFGLAGLWDRSIAANGKATISCAVITLPGNELMRDIHNGGANPYRMPAILAPAAIEAWLAGTAADARAELKEYPSGLMVAHPVGNRVNSPKNNDPALIDPRPSETAAAQGSLL